jgi:hypothetical protein
MEEVCHIFLGHLPNRVGAASLGSGFSFRDYDQADEEEAYAVGAAALVPYHILRTAINRRLGIREIAQWCGVSNRLVEYRLKVSKLWRSYHESVGIASVRRCV